MNYKSLMLSMVFILAFGINTNYAKDKPYKCPCNCIDLVEDAVNDVISSSYCDINGKWEVPDNLENQFEDFQQWCSNLKKPLKSKKSDIIDEMLETIYLAIVGESYNSDGETIVISKPAPDCAIEALLNLQTLLLYGCPQQIIE